MKLHKSSPGVALVIVLGFLVLISALTVAFFSSVSTELKASRNFASGVSTRQLADSAVQMVMGQIRDATTRPSGCWASQPGMIRVYRDNANTPSAHADAFLKLYSSNNMVVTKNQLGNFDPTSDYFNGWASNPAYWTDLNAPVLVTDPTNPTGPKMQRFPIIDPSAAGFVDGFSFNGGAVGATTTNPLPMPVQWLYVLQDGTLLAPDSGGAANPGTTANFTGNIQPSQANPIVGRIAFWADDETSKLNVNTAAGYMPNNVPSGYTIDTYAGSYWDTPRFYSNFDMGQPNATGMPDTTKTAPGGLAICQLLQNEFQRYPGHPATTSLNPVFGSSVNAHALQLTQNQLYTLVPRYTYLGLTSGTAGSSQGGTYRVPVTVTTYPNPTPDIFQLQPKPDRLYASVDELLLAAKSTSDWNFNSYVRRTNNNYVLGLNDTLTDPSTLTNSLSALSPVFLDKIRFFVTTQSRAPELNLFGQPRVAIWPVRYQTSNEGNVSTTNGLNAFDNTILFCSSVGQSTNTSPPNTESVPTTSLTPASNGVLPYRYIFTRRELRSPGTTYSTDTIPNSPDVLLARNHQLITYLQNMTGSSPNYTQIPGFGGSFLNKYQLTDRDGILAEIFDYIRCANAKDTTTMDSSGTRNPAMFAPNGIIMPTRAILSGAAYSHGMGRFPTVSEATLVFYYAGARPDLGLSTATVLRYQMAKDLVDTTPQKFYYPTHRRYRAFFLLSTFNPMQGYAPTSNPTQFAPKIGFTVTGLDTLTMQTWKDAAATIAGDITSSAAPPAPATAYYPVLAGTNPNGGQPIFPNQAQLGLRDTTGRGAPAPTSPYTAQNAVWSTKLYVSSGGTWGGRNYGGYEGFMHTLLGQDLYWAPNKIARGNVAGSGGTSPTTTNFLRYPYNAVSAGGSANTASSTFGTSYQEFYELQSPDPDLLDTALGASPNPVPNGNPLYLVHPCAEIAVPERIAASKDVKGNLVLADTSDKYFTISGGLVNVQITYGGLLVQTLTLNIPPTLRTGVTTQVAWPLPQGDPALNFKRDSTNYDNSTPGPGANYPNGPFGWETGGYGTVSAQASNFGQTTALNDYYWHDTGSFYPTWHQSAGAAPANTVLQTTLSAAFSLPARINWSMQNSWAAMENSAQSAVNYYAYRWRNIVQPGDTIRSLIYCNTPNPAGATNSGDMRLALLQDTSSDYHPHPEYYRPYNRACLLRMADGQRSFPPGGYPTGVNPLVGSGVKIGPNAPSMISGSFTSMDTGWGNHIPLGGTYPGQTGIPRFPPELAFGNFPMSANGGQDGGVNGVILGSGNHPGDFDTGIGSNADGPFGNKQDEGNVIYAYQDPLTGIWDYPIPYFSGTWQYQAPGNTYTSPCRQMPSPAMFGSLLSKPTSAAGGWATLCFCPNPAAGPSSHPGTALSPKDHLLLDLFQMPVVEPYPISEPFSTAGKVNLNYKIAPFGYINRSTALRGALTPLRVTAVDGNSNSHWTDTYLIYKSGQRDGSGNLIYQTNQTQQPQLNIPVPVQANNWRLRLNIDETINAFDAFFAQGAGAPDLGFFKSASQVCEMYLYPQGTTYAGTNMGTWWNQNGVLTGDNLREKPYVDLYNRVTTKSNSFTVHMRVQTLRQLPRTGSYANWNEGKDVVLGEYRGSSTIERYIDPADRRFDSTNSVTVAKGDWHNPDLVSVEDLYRFRTVISKKFSP